jgi:Tol biopolymer transport system component
MLKKLFLLFFAGIIALSACGTFEVSIEHSPTPTIDAGAVATIVAATLAAYPTPTGTPPPPTLPILPHSLYYWKTIDPQTNLGQVYRLEQNGLMNTQVTNEPEGVSGQFDVSPLDGQLAYNTGKQFVLIGADGHNRRVVSESTSSANTLAWPCWSPDGKTLAYANNGVYFYSADTGVSKLVMANDATRTYSPRGFSPDGSKLLLSTYDQHRNTLGVYDLVSKVLTFLQPSEKLDLAVCCSRVAWSSDSNQIYLSEKDASSGCPACTLPGLWRYDVHGSGTALLPGLDNSGTIIQNKTAGPWLDAAGRLMFLFSPPGSGSNAAYSLFRSDPDGVTNRTALRPELFYVVSALWAPKGEAVLIVQNDGSGANNQPANLVLVPVDASRPVVTLLPDTSRIDENSLRWGP